MTRTTSIVLCLCLGLLAPQLVNAQAADPTDDPLADVAGDDTSAPEEAPGPGKAAKPQPAPVEEVPAMATVPPNAVESEGEQAAEKTSTATLKLQAKSDKEAAAATGEQDSKKKERCAQLMAQGQVALAQAEGCGGGDQPIWAGTIVSFTQTTAPAYRYLPDHNPFYATTLYFAPRVTLTKKWALNADISLAYEATVPDDTAKPHKLQTSDTRLLLNGNLGSIGGFTFTGGPRVSLPTSEPSWAADVYAGLGAGLNIIRSFEVLEGLSFIAGGAYAHTFSGRLTRKIREDDAPPCATTTGGETTDCAAGNLRVVQDSLRAVGAASLNFTSALNMQLSYVYGWSFAKPFADGADQVDRVTGDEGSDPQKQGTSTVGANIIPDTRMRRVGSFGLSVSYQPLPWLIASLQGNTSVCYDFPSGGQSAFGGCAGGVSNKDFWTNNPIANKFSTVGLQFTVPVDALYDALRSKESETKSAKLPKGKPRI